MKKKSKPRKPKDLDLETLVLKVCCPGWIMSGPDPGKHGFAWGKTPRIAREIAKWLNDWADWYEHEKD